MYIMRSLFEFSWSLNNWFMSHSVKLLINHQFLGNCAHCVASICLDLEVEKGRIIHGRITCTTTIPFKSIIRIIIFSNSNVRGYREAFLKVILLIAYV